MVPADVIASAFVDGVLIGSVYALIAMGLALIWGVMEVINFAQGDYMMLGAFITYWLLVLAGVDPIASLPISFAVVFGLGVLTQRYVINRILYAPFLSQISATFAVLLMIRYGAEALFGPYTRRIVTWYTEELVRLGPISVPLMKLVAFFASIAIVTSLYLFMTRTYTGIALKATSQNRTAALLLGINIRRMYELAFGIGVGISAAGGTLLSTFYPIYPEMGGFFCLIAFISVVFGGFGSVFGAYLAGIIIGVVESLSALFTLPTLKDVFAFLVFIIIILVKPTGLFGK